MTILGYNHIAIPVTNLAESMKFYGEVLGFPELSRPEASVPGAWFGVGNAQLHLTVLDEVIPPAIGVPHIALSVSAEDFLSVIATLHEANANEMAGPRNRPVDGVDVWSALYRDPDGNVIEITDAAV